MLNVLVPVPLICVLELKVVMAVDVYVPVPAKFPESVPSEPALKAPDVFAVNVPATVNGVELGNGEDAVVSVDPAPVTVTLPALNPAFD